jgi:hypothetical protein
VHVADGAQVGGNLQALGEDVVIEVWEKVEEDETVQFANIKCASSRLETKKRTFLDPHRGANFKESRLPLILGGVRLLHWESTGGVGEQDGGQQDG